MLKRDPWQLISGGQTVDPDELLSAVANREVDTLDHRSRLLARDAVKALSTYWGDAELSRRLHELPRGKALRANMDFSPGEDGFPTLRHRLLPPTDTNLVLQMLRELGTRITTPTSLIIGGSIVLMLDQWIARTTEDVDVVDELAATFRDDHALLDGLATRYGLKLAQFQSRYLPDGWQNRLRSLGAFGKLNVRLVDSMDVLAGKLFSVRTKDLDDVRLALNAVDRQAFEERIHTFTNAFRADPRLFAAATQNWFSLTWQITLP